ncbi:class I SAM-dependent methyltransferase [Bradyrhizobium sp.]|uniref:class I SAM-dependent methyltransferase n=1 Tax=Bradyrhizobium sp. TaxID=376 RepID=UPI0025BC68DA|nr:class I SAM-dependent methyltransferase [Bradyrhizobium sp.]
MKDLFYVRHTCRLCHSDRQDLVLPMAGMPIGTPNFHVPNVSVDDPVFRTAVPLELYLCRECGHVQILHVGNPEIQYRHYVYTTSLSLGLREHFATYADDVVRRYLVAPDSLIVELGSNDGSLLGFFRERGMRVLGVDPAVAIAKRATEQGIETIADFFTDAVGERIRQSKGTASVVIANNMIANVDNLDPLVSGVRDVLGADGVFIFETQYGVDVTEKNLLDTVYHEHLSYFNVKPLTRFFARLGMEVIDVQHIWTKGGSIRVTVQRAGGPRKASPEVARFIAEEDRLGVDQPSYYKAYQQKIAAIRNELGAMADACRARGQLVAGYGVSVGTTTLLPQFGLENKVDFLVDDDPNKGSVMAGPGYDIPILPPTALYERKPALVVVFAWRYIDPIRAKHERYFAEGGKFVVPLPAVSVVGRGN